MSDLLDLLAGEPSRTAISSPDRDGITYAALAQQSTTIGRQLRGAGVGTGRPGRHRGAQRPGDGEAHSRAWRRGVQRHRSTPAYKADEFDFYLKDLAASALVVDVQSTSPAVDVATSLGVPVLRIAESAAAGSFRLDGVAEAEVAAAASGRNGVDPAHVRHHVPAQDGPVEPGEPDRVGHATSPPRCGSSRQTAA